jgi:hypothetical protein
MTKTAAHKYADEFLASRGIPVITYVSRTKRIAYVAEEYVLFLEEKLAEARETIDRQAEDLRFITEARR